MRSCRSRSTRRGSGRSAGGCSLRLAIAVVLVEAVGVWLVATGSDAWRAAGTSLIFPGAGFLYVGWPLLFVVTAAVMVIATVLWWGASAHLAIPLVWLGERGRAPQRWPTVRA